MSEIKAQLLGIILVVACFAAVGTFLVTAFSNAGESAASKIEEEPALNSRNSNLGNLVFVD